MKRYEKFSTLANVFCTLFNHMTGCVADIRVSGMEQALRYAVILMDYADESKQEFDELLIEKNRYGAIWLHFAVRPKENRRKILFINT